MQVMDQPGVFFVLPRIVGAGKLEGAAMVGVGQPRFLDELQREGELVSLRCLFGFV